MIGPPSPAGTAVIPPSAAAIPIEPIDPIGPVDPVELVDPVDPVDPIDPVDPLEPIGPPSAPGAPTGPAFCPPGVDEEGCMLLPLPPLSHAAAHNAIATEILNHWVGE